MIRSTAALGAAHRLSISTLSGISASGGGLAWPRADGDEICSCSLLNLVLFQVRKEFCAAAGALAQEVSYGLRWFVTTTRKAMGRRAMW